MKLLIVCFFLFAGFTVAALTPPFGLSIQTDKESYLNSETILISGYADSESVVTIVGRLHDKTIFEKKVTPDPSGSFSFSYPISFLNPVGDWQIFAKDYPQRLRVSVLPTPESATLVLAFSSPGASSVKRTEEIPFNVRLTKNSEPVLGAQVVMYGPTGERIALAEKGGGNYGTGFVLSRNAPLGNWGVLVQAEATIDRVRLGGINRIALEVIPSPIQFDFESPVFPEYKVGEALNVSVKPRYSDGDAVQNPIWTVSVGNRALELEPSSENTFAGSLLLEASDAGEQLFSISVVDDANNSGVFSQVLRVTGASDYQLMQWFPFLLGLGVVLLISLHFVWSRKTIRARQSRLELEREAFQSELKTLQQKYFEEKSVPESVFEKKSAELSVKLSKTEEQLKAIKNENEKPK